MIEIKVNYLYTRGDLAAMLEPAGVDVDHFIGRLRPVKRFKQLYWGMDLLDALKSCPALAERSDAPMPPAANRGNRKRRRGAAVVDYPGSKLDAYRRTLKGERL